MEAIDCGLRQEHWVRPPVATISLCVFAYAFEEVHVVRAEAVSGHRPIHGPLFDREQDRCDHVVDLCRRNLLPLANRFQDGAPRGVRPAELSQVVGLEEVSGEERTAASILRVEHLERCIQVADSEDNDIAVIEEELREVVEFVRAPAADDRTEMVVVGTQIVAGSIVPSPRYGDAIDCGAEVFDEAVRQVGRAREQRMSDEGEAEIALLTVDDVRTRTA
nr:hypothetical protein [Brevibacterium yomogidense]